jgi:hypothetical protein
MSPEAAREAFRLVGEVTGSDVDVWSIAVAGRHVLGAAQSFTIEEEECRACAVPSPDSPVGAVTSSAVVVVVVIDCAFLTVTRCTSDLTAPSVVCVVYVVLCAV